VVTDSIVAGRRRFELESKPQAQAPDAANAAEAAAPAQDA